MPYAAWPLNDARTDPADLFVLVCLRPLAIFLASVVATLTLGRVAYAQAADHHVGESSDHHGLHFSHPVVAESPSPDTKIRLDYAFRDIDGEGTAATMNTVRLEAEYAFHRVFSVEVDVPYSWLDLERSSSQSNLDNVEIALKFANFAFEEQGFLLGYGIEFTLPTGDNETGIGSSHIFEIEPFLDAGYKRRDLEVVAFTGFGIPTNQDEGEETETELGYNLSLLYHFSPRLQGLVELDGESVLSGEESGESVVNVSPGIKLYPVAGRSLILAFSAGFPVSAQDEFDTRALLSVFYHF